MGNALTTIFRWLGISLLVVVGPLATSLAATAQPMTFYTEAEQPNCGECTTIYASGVIVATTPQSLEQLLSTSDVPPGSTLVLNSPGGNLFAGLEMAQIIRRARLHTSVYARSHGTTGSRSATCASACVYAFLGGVHRTVADGPRIGLHQFSTDEEIPDAISAAQSLVSVLSEEVRRLGGSPMIVETASRIPPGDILWLTPSQLNAWSVVTAPGTRFDPRWSIDRSRPRYPSLIASALQSDGSLVHFTIDCPMATGPQEIARWQLALRGLTRESAQAMLGMRIGVRWRIGPPPFAAADLVQAEMPLSVRAEGLIGERATEQPNLQPGGKDGGATPLVGSGSDYAAQTQASVYSRFNYAGEYPVGDEARYLSVNFLADPLEFPNWLTGQTEGPIALTFSHTLFGLSRVEMPTADLGRALTEFEQVCLVRPRY
jgi:hypothetical protein